MYGLKSGCLVKFLSGCVGYHLTAVYGRQVDKDWIAAQIALAEAAIGDWKKKEDDWRTQAR